LSREISQTQRNIRDLTGQITRLEVQHFGPKATTNPQSQISALFELMRLNNARDENAAAYSNLQREQIETRNLPPHPQAGLFGRLTTRLYALAFPVATGLRILALSSQQGVSKIVIGLLTFDPDTWIDFLGLG
jgi:hypothetical protein